MARPLFSGRIGRRWGAGPASQGARPGTNSARHARPHPAGAFFGAHAEKTVTRTGRGTKTWRQRDAGGGHTQIARRRRAGRWLASRHKRPRQLARRRAGARGGARRMGAAAMFPLCGRRVMLAACARSCVPAPRPFSQRATSAKQKRATTTSARRPPPAKTRESNSGPLLGAGSMGEPTRLAAHESHRSICRLLVAPFLRQTPPPDGPPFSGSRRQARPHTTHHGERWAGRGASAGLARLARGLMLI